MNTDLLAWPMVIFWIATARCRDAAHIKVQMRRRRPLELFVQMTNHHVLARSHPPPTSASCNSLTQWAACAFQTGSRPSHRLRHQHHVHGQRLFIHTTSRSHERDETLAGQTCIYKIYLIYLIVVSNWGPHCKLIVKVSRALS